MHKTDTLPHASLRRATPIPEICQKCDRFAAFAGASAKYLGERKGELTKKRGDELPHSEVKLINPATGAVLLCEERGELCCRGYQVMAGYYKMPEQTHTAIDSEGWLHTGDLAMMNAQGSLIIVGRLKEMVIRGENIFPREVEEFLLRHPKVADVCVVGVPDAFFGEELLAVVRPKEGADVTEQDLREFYKRKVSHQKIPRYFQFVDAYPLTASGKVQKFVLREQAIQALGLQEIANSKQDTERLLNEMTAVYVDCLRSPEHAAVRADLKAHEKTT